jgi:hypothetical protein
LPYAAFTDGRCTDKFEATVRFVVLLQGTSVCNINAADNSSPNRFVLTSLEACALKV